MPDVFVDVAWGPEDVRTLAPTLTDEQAADFLCRHEKHIQDRLTELGWGVIEDLLIMEGIPRIK